jgi:NitT/TauT family transport system substrate-binding protein
VTFSTYRRVRSAGIGALVGLLLGALVVAVAPAGASTSVKSGPTTLHLGYFDNVTHAPALVALQGDILKRKLGANSLETSIFNAGPAEVTAILSGSIDAGYIGPNPTVTAFVQSHGAVQVISGAASGGGFLVVKPSIKSVKDLKGKRLATPQLGNTQDVALRSFLKKKGLSADTSGGGDVSILPEDNSTTVTAFVSGSIDGAWVPEPYATRLVKEGGGKILVDERTLWPAGKYVTTDVIVRKDYLKAHPDVVQQLLEANVAAIDLINKKPADAQKLVADKISSDTGKPLAGDLIAASFKNIVFTPDPVSTSLVASAKAAVGLGLPGATSLTKTDVKNLYNLKLLNKVLKANNQPTVSASAT